MKTAQHAVGQFLMLMFMLALMSRCSSRLWGLLSLRGHNPLRSLLLCSASQVLAEIVALILV